MSYCTYKQNQNRCASCQTKMQFITISSLIVLLWLQNVLSFVPLSTNAIIRQSWRQSKYQVGQQEQQESLRLKSTTTVLYAGAAKLVYKWRVLPSGSLTGICADGLITTSALKRPESATSNAIVTTASGSQYKLMGESVSGTTNSFVKPFTPSPPSIPASTSSNGGSSLTTISAVALVTISGVFTVVVLQKLGVLESFSIEDAYGISNLSWRAIALIIYCIGVFIATIQLVNDSNKLS
jgi:hypothetical protein